MALRTLNESIFLFPYKFQNFQKSEKITNKNDCFSTNWFMLSYGYFKDLLQSVFSDEYMLRQNGVTNKGNFRICGSDRVWEQNRDALSSPATKICCVVAKEGIKAPFFENQGAMADTHEKDTNWLHISDV